jgi:RNA polymerase sigma factor (sigma-70 family)
VGEQVWRNGKWEWLENGLREPRVGAEQVWRDGKMVWLEATTAPHDGPGQPGQDLDALYADNLATMINYARRYLSATGIPESRLSAEDVVQEAWMVVLRKRAVIDSPIAYAYEVVRRRVRQETRRKLVMEARDPDDVDYLVPWTDQSDLAHDVRLALLRLPPEQRTVAVRTCLLGETHAEVAEGLGVSKGTVASRAYRARSVLAMYLAALLTLVTWIVYSQREYGSQRTPCQDGCPPGLPVPPPDASPPSLPFDPGGVVSDVQWGALGLALVLVVGVWRFKRMRTQQSAHA